MANITKIKNQKTTLIVTGIVLGSVILGKLIKGLTSNRSKEEVNSRTQQISLIKINPAQVSISESQANLIAQSLLSAMDRYGTDYETIKRNILPLNKNDLLLVIKSFGIKQYNGVGLPANAIDRKLFSTDLNLMGWLQRELTKSQQEEIRPVFVNAGVPF